MTQELTVQSIKTEKEIPDTLASLRKLMRYMGIEDYEPIRGEDNREYRVRFLRNGKWLELGCTAQMDARRNLRVVYNVIKELFHHEEWGAFGSVEGRSFMGSDLVTTEASSRHSSADQMAEAFTVLGVEPEDSMEEVTSVYHAKVKHSHPDMFRDPQEKKRAEERTKRLTLAYDRVTRVKGG